MNRSNPPRIPTWLLDRFGVTDRNEALTGDLIEEFRSGRSRLWYWAHAFLAIVVTAHTDFWQHKLLVARAVLVGEIIVTVLSYLFGITVHRWGPRFGIVSVSWWLYTLVAVFVLYAISGWVVGRFHEAQRGSMVLWYAVLSCCLCVAWSFPLLSMHFVNSLDSPRFRPYLAFDLANLANVFIAILVGGLFGGKRKARTYA